MVAGGGRYPVESRVNRDFGRSKGAGATVILKAWQKYYQGVVNHKGMTGDRAEAPETGDAQVSRGPCGDTTWENYSRTEKGVSMWADDPVQIREERPRR